MRHGPPRAPAQRRNPDEFAEIREDLSALPDCPIGKEQWSRALWVYERLSGSGGAHQRSVKHPDLLIAAAAEAAAVTLLHYDEDYERIAAITGQPGPLARAPGQSAVIGAPTLSVLPAPTNRRLSAHGPSTY